MNISFLKAIAEEELYRLDHGTDLYDGTMTIPEYMKKRETLLKVISEVDEVYKIKEITERALRSEDPINLYKAQALVEISKILGADSGDRIEAPENDSEQITFDDILKEG